jgi:alpha-N-arabinofuranosidase
MPTFGEWERTVLDHTYDYVDYLSMHCYYGNKAQNTPDFLARAEDMDRFIKTTAKICDEIKEKKNSSKTVNLSFDEWNVWYRTKDEEKTAEKWLVAPHLLEEKYNFEDALLVGCMLITLQNNCDRVKIACLAQLINVIAPIMTENDGGAWKQTIFYPYMYASLYGNGEALKSLVECSSYKSKEGWDIPYLCTSTVYNESKDEVVIFAVNRSLDEDMELSIDGLDGYKLVKHTELYSDSLNETNDKDNERVKPNEIKVQSSFNVSLKKHSWNMLILKK